MTGGHFQGPRLQGLIEGPASCLASASRVSSDPATAVTTCLPPRRDPVVAYASDGAPDHAGRQLREPACATTAFSLSACLPW
jgi:hypothetical protein